MTIGTTSRCSQMILNRKWSQLSTANDPAKSRGMEWNGFKAWMVDGAENLNSAKKKWMKRSITLFVLLAIFLHSFKHCCFPAVKLYWNLSFTSLYFFHFNTFCCDNKPWHDYPVTWVRAILVFLSESFAVDNDHFNMLSSRLILDFLRLQRNALSVFASVSSLVLTLFYENN